MKTSKIVSLLLTIVVVLSMATIANAETLQVVAPEHMHEECDHAENTVANTSDVIGITPCAVMCPNCGRAMRKELDYFDIIYVPCRCCDECEAYVWQEVAYSIRAVREPKSMVNWTG